MLPCRVALLGFAALLAAGCGAVTVFITPEGNIAFGPPRAARGALAARDRGGDLPDRPPRPHVNRSAFERWQPPPLGVLPPGLRLRNTSVPVPLAAGPLTLVLRASDRLMPSWGGDTYVRLDLEAGTAGAPAPPRDLGLLLDARAPAADRRARRIASALFETLHTGDRGALVTSSREGRVLVPLLSHGAAPLLIERTHAFEAAADANLALALEHAVTAMASRERARVRRLIVLSDSSELVSAESLEWIEAATSDGIEVLLVPLSPAAAERLEPLALHTQALVLPTLPDELSAETAAIEELSSLPPAATAASDVTVVLESIPGPAHLIEVAGATPVWTPEGGEVPLGALRAGDSRTLVLRVHVPSWQVDGEHELRVRVRYRDEGGPHEVQRLFAARYSDSPRRYAASRAGDVLQYVSLLNTLSNVQAALQRGDHAMLASLREAATLQAHSLLRFAAEHDDAPMAAQAALLRDLLMVSPPPP